MSKNEAEYETLLIGLQAAWVLMVQQMKAIFEIKDKKLWKYCEIVERSWEHFMEMHLK